MNGVLGLDIFFRIVDQLFLDGDVFNTFHNSLLWDVFDVLIVVDLWDVLSHIFNCVDILDSLCLGDVLNALNGLVLDDVLLVWNVLYSGFSLD